MRIVFAGTPEFAASHLDALIQAGFEVCSVWTQPDKPGKRGTQPVPSAVKRLASRHNISVYQPARIDRVAIKRLSSLQPDIMAVVAYGQILPKAALQIPTYGCINVHASILPRWRGAAPIQRAIQAGDDTTGITIMQMDPGLDTGDILTVERCSLEKQDTSASLMQKLSLLGPKTLIKTLRLISSGAVKPIKQSDTGATYARKLTKQEAAIDWSLTAIEIERNIRMLNPSPVAFTWLNSLRVKLWQAECCNMKRVTDAVAGEILGLQKDGLFIACGTGVLKITALQIPIGKGKILSATDLHNSRRDLFVQREILQATAN
ncbi:MAG: methionyl-tRNA formyltransferase [Gammaproteobacteria bacterium]|nr:methionyl-tRNA formyltransferase [Gammaproteobacteria bacterium]